MTPSQSPPGVFLRSSATDSASQQSILGILVRPSGRLLSDPSCRCSNRKPRVALNKVLCALFFNNELLRHTEHLQYSTLVIFHPHPICLLVYFTFLAFLEALPHLCQHVKLVGGDGDSHAVLCALIGLMEDSDPAVRTCFSQSVRFLLTETSRNSEQDSLSEVSNSSVETKKYIFFIMKVLS